MIPRHWLIRFLDECGGIPDRFARTGSTLSENMMFACVEYSVFMEIAGVGKFTRKGKTPPYPTNYGGMYGSGEAERVFSELRADAIDAGAFYPFLMASKGIA